MTTSYSCDHAPGPFEVTTRLLATDVADATYLIGASKMGPRRRVAQTLKFTFGFFALVTLIGFAPHAMPDGGRYLCAPQFWSFDGDCVAPPQDAACAARYVALMMALKASASSVAVGMLVYVPLIFCLRAMTRSNYKRIMKGEAPPPKHIVVDETGVQQRSDGIVSHFAWSVSRDVLESRDVTFLRFGFDEGVVIANRDLTPQARAALVGWIDGTGRGGAR